MMNFINRSGFVAGRKDSFLVRIVLLFCLLFALAACDSKGPECVDANDWGQFEKVDLTVDPKNPYTHSGISVASGSSVEVEVGGLIDICGDDVTLGPSNAKQPNNITPGTKPIDPWIKAWQDSGVKVEEGSKLTIKISGSYFDRTREQTDGRGLYAYIGETAPSNSDWWYGAEGGDQPEDNKKTGNQGAYPEFFELFDNGTVGEGGGYSWTVPKGHSGTIWFKYARSADARGIKKDGNGQYSPWRGAYAWEAPRCELCMHTVIIATCYQVTSVTPWLFPICVTGWESSCAGTGHLEAAPGESGKNCREQITTPGNDDDPKDHWVNGDYMGTGADEWYNRGNGTSAPKNMNDGGYEISIGSGCPGTFGRYMEMHIGTPKVKLKDKTEPEGCTPGEDVDGDGKAEPCSIVLNEWGDQPIKIAEYSMTDPDITSMDLRGKDEAGKAINGYPKLPYYKVGGYKGKFNASGELLFYIRDEASSVSHPIPGYYGDNTGSYDVKIKAIKSGEFSRFAQSLINPVKALVFGYCRMNDNEDTPVDESLVKYSVSQSECPGDRWMPGITTRMYNKLVGGAQQTPDGSISGNPFLDALRAALVLYVIIYGGLFMMGMVEDKQEEFLRRVIKFGVVSILLSPGSWEFFSVHLFDIFTHGLDDMISIMAGEFSGSIAGVLVDPATGAAIMDDAGKTVATSGNIFAFADQTMSMFMRHETFIKVTGLIFQSPIGIIYVILIIVGMGYYIAALATALILYLLAILAISLLLIMAPIFISLMLFQTTKEYFDGWINHLLNYLAQPVLVFTALSIFNIFIYSAIFMLLYYRVCWMPILTIDVGLTDIPLLSYYKPDGPDGLPGLPVQFFLILIFMIICNAMLKFIDWMAEMAATITSHISSTSLAAVANKAYAQLSGAAMAVAGAVAEKAANVSKGAAMGGYKDGAKGAARGALQGMTKKD